MNFLKLHHKYSISVAALLLGGLYTAISAVWIFATDAATGALFHNDDHQLYETMQTAKGLFFVFCSGSFISWIVLWYLRSIEKSARKLEESEKSYRILFEQNPNPMWIYEKGSLKFLAVNEAALVQYGYSREEFLGMSITDIRPPEDVLPLKESLKESTGYRSTGVWRHLRKDRTEIQVEVSSNDTEYYGAAARMVIALDVTEKKKLEAQLLRTQRLESIGSVASGIAHDLRNILSPIMLSVEVLKQTRKNSDEDRFLLMIEESAKRGTAIIRQMLSFVRGDGGLLAPLNVPDAIRDIETVIRQSFPANITLGIHFEAPLPEIESEATQLHQILLNLCVNSRDAMPDGGSITISVAAMKPDAHILDLYHEARETDYVVITVADTGTGIRPEIIHKIYDQFFTTKDKSLGTGLGLSTVKNIVKNHGGFITLDSEPGRGTTFMIWLPAFKTIKIQPVYENIPQEGHKKSSTILVLNNEGTMREMTAVTLEAAGYTVLLARTEAEVIKLASDTLGIDCVFVDSTPDIAGFLKTISGVNSNAKILVAHTPGTPGEFAGANLRAIAKPYTSSALLKALSN